MSVADWEGPNVPEDVKPEKPVEPLEPGELLAHTEVDLDLDVDSLGEEELRTEIRRLRREVRRLSAEVTDLGWARDSHRCCGYGW